MAGCFPRRFFGTRAGVPAWPALLLALTLASPQVLAQPDGARGRILIGMSTPLSGPAARYGQGLLQGVQLGLARLNESGGVAGRPIELLVRDDAGEPDQARAHTRALLDAGVVALTGYHGTRSIEASLALVEPAGVPMVGAASSAESLREPPRRTLFHLRAGAAEELAAVAYQLDTQGMTRVGVIAQDDGLGRDGLERLRTELARMALRPAATALLAGRDGPGGLAAALQSVCAAEPQAVLLAIDASLALALVRQAREAGCRPQFVAMSETGAGLQAGAAGGPRELAGLMVSQVLPHPAHVGHPLAAEYGRALARQAGAEPSYPGLEGYLYARVLGEALRQCARRLTPACLIEVLENRAIDLPGLRVQFAPQHRRGPRFVELTLLDGQGRFRR